MTSNLGTADLRKAAIGFGKMSDVADHERMKEKVNSALKAHFRPEFLNRIDDTIVFHELTKEEVILIADMFITRLRDQLGVRDSDSNSPPRPRDSSPTRGTTPNSVRVRFAVRCSSTSKTR